jgi:hypothetical protein
MCGNRNVLAVFCLFAATGLPLGACWAADGDRPAGRYKIPVVCNGGKAERTFLSDEVSTKVKGGSRTFLSGTARALYRFEIGDATPERVHVAVLGASWILESSPDGERWETLFRSAGKSTRPRPFSQMGCGFSPWLKQAASDAGLVYVRLGPCEVKGDAGAIELLTLEVSAAARPSGFVPVTAANPMRRIERNLPLAALDGVGLLFGLALVLVGRRRKRDWTR